MLDALEELFQEHRNKVTPKQVAARMGQKLHKQIPLHLVTGTYASFGFITKKAIKQAEESQIIPNPELLAEIRAQFGRANGNTDGNGKESINYPIL